MATSFTYYGVNMPRLVDFFQSRSSINPEFDSRNFFTGSTRYSEKDYLQGRDNEGTPKKLLVYAGLNRKQGRLDLNIMRYLPQYYSDKGQYAILIPYYTEIGQTIEYAIKVYSTVIEDFLQVAELIYPGQRKRIFEDLLRLAKNQLNASGKTNNLALAKWYENASPHIIAGIDFNTRITHLEQMLSGYVSQYGRADTEKAILNILRSFLPQYNNEPANLKPNQLSQTQSTLLLNLLMEKGAKTKAILLTSLYDKLNDFGGDNNFTAAMLLLYNLWDNSVFKLPSYHEYQDFPAPTNLPYNSEKKFGFYQANMTFEFKGATVHVEEQKFEKVYAGKAGMIDKEYYVPFGDYHLYQPVTAFSKKTEGAIPLPNFAMPAFYLKAAADKNKWENVEKGTFLAIDVASLFIGVGMFVRLARTVQVLSKTQKTLALFNAGLQVSSGAVGTMLNFVDENKYPDFCNKLRTVLIVIDLATLGGDFVTSKMLKEAAEDALKAAPDALKSEKRWVEVERELEKLKGLKSIIRGKPIAPELLKQLQNEFKKVGGLLKYDEESFAYINLRQEKEGVLIEAITFSEDLILLGKDVSKSGVYEELIHAEQFRVGKFNEWSNQFGNEVAINLMEKEAAETLLRNREKWKIPKDELELISERLEQFENRLKELGYGK